MGLKRLNFNLQEELVDRIDEWAKKRCIPRSAAISLMCSQYLDSQSMLDSLPELVKAVRAEEFRRANTESDKK